MFDPKSQNLYSRQIDGAIWLGMVVEPTAGVFIAIVAEALDLDRPPRETENHTKMFRNSDAAERFVHDVWKKRFGEIED